MYCTYQRATPDDSAMTNNDPQQDPADNASHSRDFLGLRHKISASTSGWRSIAGMTPSLATAIDLVTIAIGIYLAVEVGGLLALAGIGLGVLGAASIIETLRRNY